MRTQRALLDAFNGLVLQRDYEEIRVADILARAAVGRSTFYEHFRNKDDVLRRSLTGILSLLAGMAGPACDPSAVVQLLEHFSENRRRARRLLRGSVAPHVVRALADQIVHHLAAAGRRAGGSGLPPRLLAQQVATAQLGLIEGWLGAELPCSASIVATALRTSTRRLVDAT